MGMTEAQSLAIESWILYTIAILIVICRTLSRRILLGSFRKLQIDDYIMYFVVTAVNLNAYLPPAFLATITPAEVQNAIYGCKWTFATEMTKLATVWGCKACLLILYNHMTKIVLFGIFSLGTLVILCAILNRYYNFTAGYGSLIYLNWYAGETSTAVIVANVPHLWPLISRVFGLGAFKSSFGPADSNSHRFHLSASSKPGIASGSRRRTVLHHHLENDGYIRSESEERIAGAGGGAAGWGDKGETDLELAPHHHHHHQHGNVNVVGGFDTNIVGGRRVNGGGGGSGDGEAPAWGHHAGGGGGGKAMLDDKDHIMKTVHINQFSEND
ncbi:MAG: hypothetical protein Q9161_009523 [Pseudevernia consocians]